MNVKDEDKGVLHYCCHISQGLIGQDRLEKKLCSVKVSFESFQEIISMVGKSTNPIAFVKGTKVKSCLKELEAHEISKSL